MKIAFIVSKFPALSETFILNQIVGMIELGHEVDIYSRRIGEKYKLHADVDKYQLLRHTHYINIPKNKFRRISNAFVRILINFHKSPTTILRSLNLFEHGRNSLSLYLPILATQVTKRYDIIHCHFGQNGDLGILLKDIGITKKVIVTFHGADVNSYPQTHGQDIYKSLFNKADLITVNSSFTLRKVVALGCKENKIKKLPVGLKPSEFPFKKRTIDPGDKMNILTVGRLVEKKGIEYSIRAVAKVMEKHPRIKYQIAGDGPLRDQLLQLIRHLGVEDKVKLLGWQDQEEIRRLYTKAHIFVLSSITASDGDQEGQGLVLQEAQAIGLPVIATLHNGFPDSLLDGTSGFLVPEKDVNALTERLQYLFEHPEIWPKMGQSGRTFVEENFDIKKLNNQLVVLYQNVIDGNLS